MKKSFIILFSVVLSFFLTDCASNKTSDNSNQANINSPAATPFVETNSANVNVQAQETPLPTFTDAETALSEGKKLLDANQTEKAVEALKQAVKLNPDLAEAHFNLGVAYALLEKENAQLMSEEPTPTPAKKGKKEVVVLTKSEKAFDSAAKAYEKIIKKNPKDDNAYFNLGRAYNKLNKDPEAEKALRQAVKLKADDSEYQTELGAILIKLAKYDDAVVVLKKALELDAENSHAQDLLDKADAGQKRINYGVKPKQPENASKQRSAKTRSTNDSNDSEPATPTENKSLPPTPAPKTTLAKTILNKKEN
ncbi:MAG: tetratricopeptide repeat protein [Pyrinomonadaceae bacterium]